jgi:hypothetical protein
VPCRPRLPYTRRIEEAATPRLVEKFSGSDPQVTPRPGGVAVHADGTELVLTREQADELRDALADALTARHEFVRTAGEHRADGSYVVERRNADSAGHRKVFESLDCLRRLYHRLPDEFTADDVGRSGLTGGRRHMVVWHLAEHPEFDCDLATRQPLTVEKRGGEDE